MPEREWKTWMRDFGRGIRQARELAGLTQIELARRSGVSQGAISRLETGRGRATSLMTVVRLLSVLRLAVGVLPRAAVPEEARRLLDLSGAEAAVDEEPDAVLVRLLALYRGLDPHERAQFVSVGAATADAIMSARSAPPRRSR